MFTLRIDSGIGIRGYRATVYGPGLPVGEPKRDMGPVALDIERAIDHVRKLRGMPRTCHVFGVTEELKAELEAHLKKRGPR